MSAGEDPSGRVGGAGPSFEPLGGDAKTLIGLCWLARELDAGARRPSA